MIWELVQGPEESLLQGTILPFTCLVGSVCTTLLLWMGPSGMFWNNSNHCNSTMILTYQGGFPEPLTLWETCLLPVFAMYNLILGPARMV